MVKAEPEFENVSKDTDCIICAAAELFLPGKGEPVLSVLPSVASAKLEADEDGFFLAAEMSAPLMERRGFEPGETVFDMTEFESSSVTDRARPTYGADVRMSESGEPYAEVSVGGVRVSFAAVNDIPVEEGTAEIYVETGERYRSRGFATLCVAALRDALVKKGKTVKYVTETVNVPSLRVAEKAGFIKKGRRLTAVFYK